MIREQKIYECLPLWLSESIQSLLHQEHLFRCSSRLEVHFAEFYSQNSLAPLMTRNEILPGEA